jgi:hypothetical protein
VHTDCAASSFPRGRGGVGTQLVLGCQDITGPFPSVLLDKAARIYGLSLLNKGENTIKPFLMRFVLKNVVSILFLNLD